MIRECAPLGSPDKLAECSDWAAHRLKTRGARLYETVEQAVVKVGPATSRPQPARSPGLGRPSHGKGPAGSGRSSSSHGHCRLGHRRSPWRPRRRHGKAPPGGGENCVLGRRRIDRRFPPPGVKHVAHEKRNLNVIFNIHMTGSSNRLEIVFLSEGEARAAVVQAVPGNPHGTGISRVLNNTGKRGRARRRPPLGRRRSRRTRGGDGGGSDPHFLDAGAAPGRGRWCTPKSTTSPPLFGGSLTPP